MSITVNGAAISDAMIEAEIPHHQDAAEPREAAIQNLIVRELLLQRATELGVAEGADEERIGNLFDQELQIEPADDAACREFYDHNPESFQRGEQIEASHILFAREDGLAGSLVKAKAEGILAELKANPSRFADLAREHSTCPSGRQGGDLGAFGRGQMVPEFEQAAFRLGDNELYDGLVETQFGFHIIRSGKKSTGEAVSFDEAKERIAHFLNSMASQRAVHEYIGGLFANADIQGYQPAVQH
ncbi:peptidylprolyl isomerase [Chitinilyticum piscinae]|uniref:peptidylprolyl isomerase n=1 Tax=Chitinilyticum piscinae TaxID=2866724 RepID=A0A8J7FZI3_9NEIS|nr:peptidylprolyl isomerase [Chitinilyticum piscinae]MBE9609200.1 peptidylprolyl isomerase [Chitinilyticum piscinae]